MNHIQSPDRSDSAIEREIVAKGKTAPRITPADLQANIVSEHYFTAAEGYLGDGLAPIGPIALKEGYVPPPPALSLLTFCVLTLRNGFTVTGESACASPENFDAEIGRKIARQNAEQKIWPLMGYALKEQLFQSTAPAQMPEPTTFKDRLRAEHAELNERLGKLEKFIDSPAYIALPGIDQADLATQASQMREYSTTLARRLGRLE